MLWQGQGDALWPETEKLLDEFDPIRHVAGMFPTAVLMINGGQDKVVDPGPARAFVEAARPFYRSDPDRLRLVIYEGMGHNLPRDIIKMYAEHWFRLYMHPVNPPPAAPEPPRHLDESAERTQINATPHQDVIGAIKSSPQP